MTARPLPPMLLCAAWLAACNGSSDSAQTQDPNLFCVKRDDLQIVVLENA